MRRFEDGSGVVVWLGERGSARWEVQIDRGAGLGGDATRCGLTDADGGCDARVDRAWAELVASNPRYYDAPMMALASLDTADDAARVVLTHESYKRFAVQDAASPVETGVTLASVTGRLALARSCDGSRGGPLVLGLRHARTRVYPGVWEHAPSGGLDAARFAPGTDERASVLDQLRAEAREELGIDADALCGLGLVALVHDPRARSIDIVVGGSIEMDEDAFRSSIAGRSWEYADVRTMEVGAFRAWMEREPEQINPQTLALERALVAAGDP